MGHLENISGKYLNLSFLGQSTIMAAKIIQVFRVTCFPNSAPQFSVNRKQNSNLQYIYDFTNTFRVRNILSSQNASSFFKWKHFFILNDILRFQEPITITIYMKKKFTRQTCRKLAAFDKFGPSIKIITLTLILSRSSTNPACYVRFLRYAIAETIPWPQRILRLVFTASRLSHSSLMQRKIKENPLGLRYTQYCSDLIPHSSYNGSACDLISRLNSQLQALTQESYFSPN